MHGVDAEIARPDDAHDGVEVGAIAVKERAGSVNGGGDLDHLGLEQAAGVGVGQHDGGDVGAERGLHRLDIDGAIGAGRDGLDRVAEEGGGRRVGAVGAFGHQHDLAMPLPGRFLRGADGHHAAHFAVGAGLGGQARRRRCW